MTLTADGLHRAWYGLHVNVGRKGIGWTPGVFGESGWAQDAPHSMSNGACTAPVAHFTMTSGSQSAQDGGTLSIETSDVNGHHVSLSASPSDPGGGTITSYSWSSNGQYLGSGSSWGGGFKVGEYSIGLSITNSRGLSSSASGNIVISQSESCDDLASDASETCEENEPEPERTAEGSEARMDETDTAWLLCWYVDRWLGDVYLGRIWLYCEPLY